MSQDKLALYFEIIPELIMIFTRYFILLYSDPWNMDNIWSIKNQNPTDDEETQHGQVI